MTFSFPKRVCSMQLITHVDAYFKSVLFQLILINLLVVTIIN
jgi:hypothetical protein